MSKSPFYKTGISKSPLHTHEPGHEVKQISEKKKLRLANKVKDAWNAQPDARTDSKEAKKFKRKLNKYKKKTGKSDWYISYNE